MENKAEKKGKKSRIFISNFVYKKKNEGEGGNCLTIDFSPLSCFVIKFFF